MEDSEAASPESPCPRDVCTYALSSPSSATIRRFPSIRPQLTWASGSSCTRWSRRCCRPRPGRSARTRSEPLSAMIKKSPTKESVPEENLPTCRTSHSLPESIPATSKATSSGRSSEGAPLVQAYRTVGPDAHGLRADSNFGSLVDISPQLKKGTYLPARDKWEKVSLKSKSDSWWNTCVF